jgi:hypothetical protein
VVADQAGRFVGVDAKTGTGGRGYSDPGERSRRPARSASPRAAVRALTDGTFLLPSLRHPGRPLEDVPVVW